MLLEQFRPLDGKVMKTGTHTHSKTRENDVLLIFFFPRLPSFFVITTNVPERRSV